MRTSFFICFLLVMFLPNILPAQQKPAFLNNYNKKWVDSVFLTMTQDQKIGQLLMPRGNYSGKPHDVKQLKQWVRQYHIGGVVFFAGGPTIQVDITNELQSISKVPLFIGQDFEWGTGMRLDSTPRFPYALALGAIPGNEEMIEKMAFLIGQHCKRLGVHINYAPVVDINNNPLNPVINFRSFGESAENVKQKSLAYMKGMEKARIICTAKHFPGHGDTKVDSHLDLPVITASKERLDSFELIPFQYLINKGVPGIMTAHLHVPALDNTPNMPATLSRKTIHDLLRNQMGFEGLIFTDAMDMKGVVKHFSQGEAIVMALIAGNDIVETFLDVPVAVEAIKKALADGRLTKEWLDFKVKKILKAKSWVGLDAFHLIPRENLVQDLNDPESEVINSQLAELSTTVLKNDKNLLPVLNKKQKIALVSLNPPQDNVLVDMIQNYASVDHFVWNKAQIDSLSLGMDTRRLNVYDLIIVAGFFHQVRPSAQYGLDEKYKIVLNNLANLPQTVLCWFGNPYSIPNINFEKYSSILCGYQTSRATQEAVGQAIFGGFQVEGIPPVTIHENIPAGLQLKTGKTGVLSYGAFPGNVKASIDLHARVDSMMNHALANQFFPGAVVQAIYKDRVIFQKAYGSKTTRFTPKRLISAEMTKGNDNTMDSFTSGTLPNPVEDNQVSNEKVKIHDVYDLASVTKIAASALAMMTWVHEGILELDAPIYTYFPEWKSFPVSHLTFRDMLAHRSGLQAWIPFWKMTIDSTITLKNTLKKRPELEVLCEARIKKPFFIARWFGKKPKKIILYDQTIREKKKELWDAVFETKELHWKDGIYSKKMDAEHTIPIGDSLWLQTTFPNFIMNTILQSPLGQKGKYVYSDLHYYFYPALCKRLTGRSFDQYLDIIYQETGSYTLTFNPLNKFDKTLIVPTEADSIFRNVLIHGYVHDEGAVMMGGISGHAGLFGTANDLSKLLYMYLKEGQVQGKRVLSKQVIKEFTRVQFPEENNRRGLAFDKNDPTGMAKNGPTLASPSAFGHSGYTGTYAWVDPEYDLVFVFLSNRVYPSRKNNLINESRFRQNLCNEFYKVIQTVKP